MNEKERFIKTLDFKSVDRVPNYEIGTWEQTARRWHDEGLAEEIDTGSFFKGNKHYNLEGIDVVDIFAMEPYPPIEEIIIEENQRHITFTDSYKRLRRALKTGTVGSTRLSMDQYISFPVTDRKSFIEYKKGYNLGDTENRYPKDWESIKNTAAGSTKPLCLLDPAKGSFGFYSMLRNWMGTEGLSYLLYDDPVLVQECIEFLCEFAIQVMKKAVCQIKFDLYWVHEDMCYNSGPLVSPAIFKKMFLASYIRFVSFLKSNDVSKVLVDTDGNFEKLIPLFIESGVDGFGPIEIAAGMDPVKLRNDYGNSLCMIGGIDKREIAKGRYEIEQELKRRIKPIIGRGGYIPSIDHAIPPSVSLENFNYYIDLKQKMLSGS